MNEWAVRHLWEELGALHQRLRDTLEVRRTEHALLRIAAVGGRCMTSAEADVALARLETRALASRSPGVAAPASAPAAPTGVRDAAARSGCVLPLDELARRLTLEPWERAAIVLCAAVELDDAYGRLFSFLRDEPDARRPTAALLAELLGADEIARAAVVLGLGPYGRLRRCRLIREVPNERGGAAELRLEAAALELVVGGRAELAGLFLDDDIASTCDAELPRGIDEAKFAALGRELARGDALVVAIHGAEPEARRHAAVHLARLAGRPLLAVSEGRELALDGVLSRAVARGALVWWDADAVPVPEPLPAALRRALTLLPVATIIGRDQPWRPLWLLTSGRYVEQALGRVELDTREQLWRETFPDEPEELHRRLATQYDMGVTEIRAIGVLANHTRARASNGHQPPLGPHLQRATSIVTRRTSSRTATLVEPRRGPEDLILEPRLHARVLEVAALHRAWADVARRWSMQRLVTGRGGQRYLFGGESGTGKTLAAEVIAGLLGSPMLRVDLAQVVSKWVGETEKNLEAVFSEAEAANAVLFFDEGDALFGKRSDIRHGTDRWANLEVSFLLQRLEDHPGLVILATNLRDNIDPAFVRRFQEVLHFPRPEPRERRRLWQLALGDRVPLTPDVELDALARIDLTGASIVDISRTAAMLALIDEREVVTLADVEEALQRDFHRHGKCLPARPRDGRRFAER